MGFGACGVDSSFAGLNAIRFAFFPRPPMLPPPPRYFPKVPPPPLSPPAFFLPPHYLPPPPPQALTVNPKPTTNHRCGGEPSTLIKRGTPDTLTLNSAFGLMFQGLQPSSGALSPFVGARSQKIGANPEARESQGSLNERPRAANHHSQASQS